MMCWESTNNFLEEESLKEAEKAENKPVEMTENLKHEEEHVDPKLNVRDLDLAMCFPIFE